MGVTSHSVIAKSHDRCFNAYMENAGKFTREQLLIRASERVVYVMRHMHEEKDCSHSRLLDDMMIPSELIVVGRSNSCIGRGYREHVVPCAMIIRRGHCMIRDGKSDDEIAAFIRDYTKIVIISAEEADHLNRKDRMGLKTRMPGGWDFGGDDIFARLTAAGIVWSPLVLPLKSPRPARPILVGL